ncbi:hypothetical protein QSV34_03190 [Porticoccus sp. W117]|uniref:tetratricopeptide repeat protein n=1 Tax=Porticoccus sp. W117 TaxID=3054777 RepID=UPI00259A1BEB|nr:hypothetical protein [Porticoccus sp. W117]MDM3870354.1 hypothetical protein [Porticoccus sp. W117]
MQQSLGYKQEALDSWYQLLAKTPDSQRRLVEGNILMLAAELGQLGKTAVALEEKVINKTADQREVSLLIQLYSKVGDSGSVIEIIEEYFDDDSAAGNLRVLREKQKVLQRVGDDKGYQKLTRKLLLEDPENQIQDLESLILSLIEEAANTGSEPVESELTALLDQYKKLADPRQIEEFTASVYQLAGYLDKAESAYHKTIASRPNDGASYLVLSNLMSRLGKTRQAARILQFLAERAERDDLFVMAIDGLLNLRLNRPGDLQWAQRVTLERLTRNPEKDFLYTLLADIADESGDVDMQLTALENSLASAKSRRGVILREMIVLTEPKLAGLGRNAKKSDIEENLKYSRRLLSLGQDFPPDVFVNIGHSFLLGGESENAMRAFEQAVNISEDNPDLILDIAQLLEAEGYDNLALNLYSKVRVANGGNLRVLKRIAELKEIEGLKGAANRLYLDGLSKVINSHKSVGQDHQVAYETLVNSSLQNPVSLRQNRTYNYQFKDAFIPLKNGFLRTLAANRKHALDTLNTLYRSELSVVSSAGNLQYKALEHFPRLSLLSQLLRHSYLSEHNYKLAAELDAELHQRFPKDRALSHQTVAVRYKWGLLDKQGQYPEIAIVDADAETLPPLLGQLVEKNKPTLPDVEYQSPIFDVTKSSDGNRFRVRLNQMNLSSSRLLSLYRELVREGEYATAIFQGKKHLSTPDFSRLLRYLERNSKRNKAGLSKLMQSVRAKSSFDEFWQAISNVVDINDVIAPAIVKHCLENKAIKFTDVHYFFSVMDDSNRIKLLEHFQGEIETTPWLITSTLFPILQTQAMGQVEQNLWLGIMQGRLRASDQTNWKGVPEALFSVSAIPANKEVVRNLRGAVSLSEAEKQMSSQIFSLLDDRQSGRISEAIKKSMELYQSGLFRNAYSSYSQSSEGLAQAKRQYIEGVLNPLAKIDKMAFESYLNKNNEQQFLVLELDIKQPDKKPQSAQSEGVGLVRQLRGNQRMYARFKERNRLVALTKKNDKEALAGFVRKLFLDAVIKDTSFDANNNSISTYQLVDMKWPSKAKAVSNISGIDEKEWQVLSWMPSMKGEDKTFLEEVSQYDFFVDLIGELYSGLAVDDGSDVNKFAAIYAQSLIRQNKAEAKADSLFSLAAAGEANRKDIALWMHLLERQPQLAGKEQLQALKNIAQNQLGLSHFNVRMMARIFSRSGENTAALNAYRSLLYAKIPVSSIKPSSFEQVVVAEILAEAEKNLAVEQYEVLVNEIVRLSGSSESSHH